MNLPLENRLLNEPDALVKLTSIRQEHIARFLSTLSSTQKNNLLRQISELDIPLFQRQQKAILTPNTQIPNFAPFQDYVHSGNLSDQGLGQEIVHAGRAAVLILAGGQGSRLRYEGPKGCCPVTQVLHKSLFQLAAEKIRAASIQAGKDLDVALMTSPLNHAQSAQFFEHHKYFGLKPTQVHFFSQQMWPLLDFDGNLFLESPSKIACGPNGNGDVFRGLVASGIWEKWAKKGVECVLVIPVDNPLADPFDFELVGFHARHKNAATVKATLRDTQLENVGLLATVDGKAAIIEYLYLTKHEREAKTSSGKWKYPIANLGLFCFSTSFIEQISHIQLPLHLARKTARKLDQEGHAIFPETPNAWKFEEFIFDVLPYASTVKALVYPRDVCFAPLKNLYGKDSIETVRAALQEYERHVFETVTGMAPPLGARFELSPQFYYPTPELLKKWKGKPLPKEEYIHE